MRRDDIDFFALTRLKLHRTMESNPGFGFQYLYDLLVECVCNRIIKLLVNRSEQLNLIISHIPQFMIALVLLAYIT